MDQFTRYRKITITYDKFRETDGSNLSERIERLIIETIKDNVVLKKNKDFAHQIKNVAFVGFNYLDWGRRKISDNGDFWVLCEPEETEQVVLVPYVDLREVYK